MTYVNRSKCLSTIKWLTFACFLSWSCFVFAREGTNEEIRLTYVEGMETTGRMSGGIYPNGHDADSENKNQDRSKNHPKSRIINGENDRNSTNNANHECNETASENPKNVDRGAIAAESQAVSAFWQLWVSVGALIFSIIGTGFLFWTLKETRKTANAAQDAISNTIRAERPYLFPINARLIEKQGKTGMEFRFDIMNYGRGVGLLNRYTCEINVPQIPHFRSPENLMCPISPGTSFNIVISTNYFDLNAGNDITIDGIIRYQGAFKKYWSNTYRFKYRPAATGKNNLIWVDAGWSELEKDITDTTDEDKKNKFYSMYS